MMGVCYQEFASKGRNIYSFTTEKYANDIIKLPLAKHYIRETTFDLKKSIFENSDLIVALAGGIGTLSEVLAFVEENRSNDKNVPIIIYDENNYYKFLLEELGLMQNEYFLNEDISKWLTIIHNYDEWNKYLENFVMRKER